MRIVIALGGNAILRRGQPMTAENQRANIRLAAQSIAAIAPGNEIVMAAESSALEGNEQYRTFIDSLVEANVDRHVELPMIAVMGDTSSGKWKA